MMESTYGTDHLDEFHKSMLKNVLTNTRNNFE